MVPFSSRALTKQPQPQEQSAPERDSRCYDAALMLSKLIIITIAITITITIPDITTTTATTTTTTTTITPRGGSARRCAVL